MKKILSLILVLCFLLPLWGCSTHSLEPHDSHTFHYRRASFQFGAENGVVDTEIRDISGHSGDWFYLIALYLSGPLDEDLISPFPSSTRLMSVDQNDGALSITLTDSGAEVLDSDFSLACVCLALTCMENPEITQVTIQNRDRTITLGKENIVLNDIPQQHTIEEDAP